MDLRILLIRRLGLLSVLLLLAITLAMGFRMRGDVASELKAAGRTADLVVAVSRLGGSQGPEAALARIRELLADGGFRHIAVELRGGPEGLGREPGSGEARLAELLAPDSARGPPRVIAEGGSGSSRWDIVIRPDPKEELAEVERDFRFAVIGLGFVSVVLLALAVFVADRALRPVREIVAGLARIESGDLGTPVREPRLREYADISRAVNRLSASLATAQANERRLARRLIELQELERREMARELHDEFGQSLTAIAANAEYLRGQVGRIADGDAPRWQAAAADIGNEARRILGHVRALLAELRPYGLEGVALRATLAELIDLWRQRMPGLSIGFDCDDLLEGVGQDAALAVYRGLQEGLTNVMRHAAATTCRVAITVDGGELELRIEDDGCGRSEHCTARGGAGLIGLRERAAIAGGRLLVEDAAPRGLRLVLRLPLGHDGGTPA